MLIANAHLVPRWATWDEFRRLEALGLTMYGQMTAGSWIYIGTQGILQGTYETFAECARAALRRHARRAPGRDRRARRHGRRPAARGDHERGGLPRRRGGRVAHPSAGWRPATATGWRPTSTGRCAWSMEAQAKGEALSVGLVGNIAEVLPELVAARASCPTCSPTRPRRTTCASATSRRGSRSRAPPTGARARLRRLRASRCSTRWWSTSRRCSSCRSAARSPSTTATTCAARWPTAAGMREAFDIPGLRARVHPAAVLPRRRAVPLGRAVGRSGRHRRRPTRRCSRPFPQKERLRRWIRQAQEQGAVPGAAGPHLLARVRRARRDGAAIQLAGEERQGASADRDRPRPPRHRLGGLAQPRDRGDEGRLGRHRRLAAAQRAAQHRLRRELGVAPPRRRRRHRLLDPRRHGGRWPTAPRWPTGGSSACSPPTRAPASCATPTPGYDLAIETARERGVDLPMIR